jgi:hypothetical protein
MKTLNELQEHRAALVAEQIELTATLPALEEAERIAPVNWNYLGNPIGSPEKTAAMERRHEVEQCLTSMASTVARIDKDIAYLELLASADSEIAAARTEAQQAGECAKRLTDSSHRIAERMAQIHSDEEQATEDANLAEQVAAQEMAKATASGDSKASKAAQARMIEAIEATRAAKAQTEANLPLVSALEAEARALAEQLETARKQKGTAIESGRRATCTRLGAEWDQAAGILQTIGASLVNQGVRYPLTGLKLPTFAPGDKTITHDHLRAIASKEAA